MYKVSTCLHSIQDEGSTQGRRGTTANIRKRRTASTEHRAKEKTVLYN